MKCFNCGKGVLYGNNVSHSKRRTKRLFKPNLHETRISVGGNRKKVRLCTKCLRLYKKQAALLQESPATLSSTGQAPVSQAAV